MNNLAHAIQSADFTGTPADVVTAFAVYVDLPHNPERWSAAGIAKMFGSRVAEGIGDEMVAFGLNTLRITYATDGIDLSDDETQMQLDAIATKTPALADACTALKAIGRPSVPRWQAANLASLPTEQEFTEAQSQIAYDAFAVAAIAILQAGRAANVSDIDLTKNQIAGL